MQRRLEGKTALVMGAGSIGPGWGNGKAAAVLFAREGADVLCVDLNESAAAETVQIIRSEGGNAIGVQADGSDDADVRRVVQSCLKEFGRIDILDNNIGIVAVGGVVDLPETEWDRVLRINLKTAFLGMKHVIPVMSAQGGGAIVNISSVASIRDTGVAYASYSASKAALNQLTRTTAVEYAPMNIRVNAILPGLMKTPLVENSAALGRSFAEGDIEQVWKARDAQVPMGRQGDAWDVAEAALFLVSDAAKYITGVELVVDGGLTLKCS